MKYLSLLLLLSRFALGDTPPPGVVGIKGGTDGTTIGNSGTSLNVNVTNGGTSTIANQGAPGPSSSPWPVYLPTPIASQSVTVTNFPSPTPTQPVSGSVSVTNFPATQPVSAVSLPLPTGAATSALQTTINTTLGSPFQAGGSIGNTSFGISGTLPNFAATPTFNLGTLNGAATNAELVTINTTLGTPFQAGGSIGNSSFGISGTLPAFAATPTFNLGTLNGAATASNQTTGNTSLATIATNIPAQGQALAAASMPVVLPASQITTLTPPTSVTVTQGTGSNLHTDVDNFPATQPISAASLPLPTGAATSALQTTGNTSLATIATNTPALGQALAAGSVPVVLPAAQITTLTPPTSVTVTQATGSNLHVDVDSAPTTTVTGTVAATQSGAWSTGRTWSLLNSTDSVNSVQSGTWTVQPGNTANTTAWLVTGTGGTFPVTGTFWQTTQPISAASLPLPTGAATSALQTTGNTSLSTISGQLPSALGAQATSASLSIVPATSSTFAISSPVNANSTLSARQTVTGTETNLVAPSNTIGVIVECESVNADNLRWGFSNSTSAILSSTLGMLCEPGRDTGYLPIGASNYLHMISTGSGSDFIDVQWVKSQ